MNRIRELREQKGLQQKELAVDIGISQPTVSDWESGRKIPCTDRHKSQRDRGRAAAGRLSYYRRLSDGT